MQERERETIKPSKNQEWNSIVDKIKIEKIDPFIIGVSGSVASGKSTFAHQLKLEFEKKYPNKKIRVISADNFLKSNAELEAKNLMDQKGFPVSFNWQALENFLRAVKSHYPKIPVRIYSHELSDLVPDQVEVLEEVDILIIEGIYLLQDAPENINSPRNYLNYSFYLDTAENNLYQWYLDRFHKMLKLNYNNPGNFFYSWAHKSLEEADKFAKDVWEKVNLKNFHEYIAPTKERADIIVEKDARHRIKKLLVKKKRKGKLNEDCSYRSNWTLGWRGC